MKEKRKAPWSVGAILIALCLVAVIAIFRSGPDHGESTIPVNADSHPPAVAPTPATEKTSTTKQPKKKEEGKPAGLLPGLPSLPKVEIQREPARESTSWDSLSQETKQQIQRVIEGVEEGMGLRDLREISITTRTSFPNTDIVMESTSTYSTPRTVKSVVQLPDGTTLKRVFDGTTQKDVYLQGDRIVNQEVSVPAWESRPLDDPSFKDVILNPRLFVGGEEAIVPKGEMGHLFTTNRAIVLVSNQEGPIWMKVYIDKATQRLAKIEVFNSDDGQLSYEIRLLDYRDTLGVVYPMRREIIVKPRSGRSANDADPGSYVTEVTDVKIVRKQE